jgi:hypothetical protein
VTEEIAKKPFKRIFSFSLFFLPDQSMPNKRMEFHECCLAPTKPRKPISPINKKILLSQPPGQKKTNKTHIADEEVKPNLGSLAISSKISGTSLSHLLACLLACLQM